MELEELEGTLLGAAAIPSRSGGDAAPSAMKGRSDLSGCGNRISAQLLDLQLQT